MTTHQLERFWWEEVAGPRSLVMGITDALLKCRNVALVIPADLPWRHQMRSSVQSVMEYTPGLDSLYIESIDVGDEDISYTPGELVLEKLALYEDRIHYRATSETVQQYAARKELLANKVVWIKGADSAQSSAWIDFCRRWHPGSPCQGLFVIEDRGTVGDPTGCLKNIYYTACADENSVRLFAWSMLSGEGYEELEPLWRTYMVSVLTSLCKEDVEVANVLANNLDIRKENPLDGIFKLSQSPVFSRRGECGSNHVLALARDGRINDLHLRLWSAQVEVLFPIIEEERINLVELLADALETLVDSGEVVQFGKVVTEIRDVELGTLVHLMSRKADGGRMLYVADEEIRELIFLLWKCRNLLAHRETCSPEEVSRLLAISR